MHKIQLVSLFNLDKDDYFKLPTVVFALNTRM